MKKTLLNVLHIMINIFIGYFFLIDGFIAIIRGSIWIIILLLLFIMTLRLLLLLIPYRSSWDMGDVTTIKIEEMQEYNKINKLILFKTQTDWALNARMGQLGTPEFPLWHAASCHAGQALNFGVSSTDDWRSNRGGLLDCVGETSSRPVGRHWRSMSEEVNWRRTSGYAMGAGCLLLRCALVIVFHCFIFHNCLCVNNQNPSDALHGHQGDWGGAGFLQSVHVEAWSTMAQNGFKWMTGASISFHAAVSYGSFVIAVRVNNHGHAGGNFWLLYQMYSFV